MSTAINAGGLRASPPRELTCDAGARESARYFFFAAFALPRPSFDFATLLFALVTFCAFGFFAAAFAGALAGVTAGADGVGDRA